MHDHWLAHQPHAPAQVLMWSLRCRYPYLSQVLYRELERMRKALQAVGVSTSTSAPTAILPLASLPPANIATALRDLDPRLKTRMRPLPDQLSGSWLPTVGMAGGLVPNEAAISVEEVQRREGLLQQFRDIKRATLLHTVALHWKQPLLSSSWRTWHAFAIDAKLSRQLLTMPIEALAQQSRFGALSSTALALSMVASAAGASATDTWENFDETAVAITVPRTFEPS